MKFNNYLFSKISIIGTLILFIGLTSCGSYYSPGYAYNDDSVYGNTKKQVEYINPNEEKITATDNSNYYKNYFKEKSTQLNNTNSGDVIFTDINSYEGSYAVENDSLNEQENYAGWGYNSDVITINLYDNSWYGGYTNWNFGYSYGYYPSFYVGWNYPSWYYGYPYYGYSNYGYSYYGYPYYGYSYYGYPYNNHYYGHRNVAYSSSRRGSTYANNSTSRRINTSGISSGRRSSSTTNSRQSNLNRYASSTNNSRVATQSRRSSRVGANTSSRTRRTGVNTSSTGRRSSNVSSRSRSSSNNSSSNVSSRSRSSSNNSSSRSSGRTSSSRRGNN